MLANNVRLTIRALTSLNLSKNGLLNKQAGKALGDMLKVNRVLKVLDVSTSGEGMRFSDMDGPGFAKELADGIKHNGTLTSVNILANYIGTERANELIEVLDRSEQLETLCGFKGDETELNLWGVRFVPWCGVLLDTHEVRRGKTTMLGADGAIMLAPEIAANGALTSLNIISNRLGAEGATHIAAVLPECT